MKIELQKVAGLESHDIDSAFDSLAFDLEGKKSFEVRMEWSIYHGTPFDNFRVSVEKISLKAAVFHNCEKMLMNRLRLNKVLVSQFGCH